MPAEKPAKADEGGSARMFCRMRRSSAEHVPRHVPQSERRKEGSGSRVVLGMHLLLDLSSDLVSSFVSTFDMRSRTANLFIDLSLRTEIHGGHSGIGLGSRYPTGPQPSTRASITTFGT